jgi:pyrimidine oxygenase
MSDCKLSPSPSVPIKIVSAGQSDTGLAFGAQYCDYNFILGTGINNPTGFAGTNQRMLKAAEKTGRDVGAYVLMMVIAEETDEAAQAKWKLYNDGADMGALSWLFSEAGADKNATEGSSAKTMVAPEGAINFNMGTMVGSYATVARLLDEAAAVPGTKGLMLTFDDFIKGMDDFGTRIQPLMQCRQHVKLAA